MGEKHDKKKESIDEILSDLNGLLNKMPSILDGIKMPEMQPADFSKPAKAPEPLPPAAPAPIPAAPFDADKTVVLESFSGLSEGSLVPGEVFSVPMPMEPFPAEPAPIPVGPDDVDTSAVLDSFDGLTGGSQAPQEITAAPAPMEPFPAEPFDADKTVVLESFSGLSDGSQVPGEIVSFQAAGPASPQPGSASPEEAEKPAVSGSSSGPQEGAAAPAPEKLAVQSLGDFMFGQDAQQEVQPEPEKPAAAAPVKLSGSPLEPPLEKPAREAVRGPSLLVSEFTPPAEKAGAPAPAPQDAAETFSAAAPEADLPGIPEAPPDQMVFNQGQSEEAQASGPQNGQLSEQAPASFYADEAEPEKPAEAPIYDSTRDFGVPDIDALMQMSEDAKPAAEQPAQSLPEAGMIPESVQAIEEQKDGPSFPELAGSRPELNAAAQVDEPPVDTAPAQELAEFELQFPAAAPQGDIVEGNKPEEEESNIRQPEEASPVPEPEGVIVKPEVKPDDSFDAFTIMPSSPEPESQPGQDGGETLRLEPSPEPQPAQGGGEALSQEPAPEAIGGAAQEPQPAEPLDIQFGAFAEPAAEPKLEPAQGIESGSGAEPEAASGQGIQESGSKPAAGIELAPGIELSVGSPAQSVSFDETLPGGPGLELGGPASQSPSADATITLAPPAGSSGEDEAIVFQASPSITSRAQAGDLSSLSAREVPEGIPAERVRSMAFLYSPGDEALCATVLAELDAICLKSADKPMFIKRAYVKECEIDANANFIHQSVSDSGAAGLVCLGAIPQEKIYEMENAFVSSGGFFRYYDAAAFTHSSALDLVADLILR
ncbi:MAG: hypothetical protein Q7R35_01060 [Elusimicrobiota bacterium]|nr:hypothetical protein [Elusimicrobiota bacterium]